MDELNKNQLILLALLVSFVTSIAASIGTASLLEQAPPKVTQTIHRVVERTVEKVVPDTTKDGPSVVTQEKTVIVREEDAITEAIANTSPSLVRIQLMSDDDRSSKDQPALGSRGIAVAVDDVGNFVTTSIVVANEQFDSYEAVLADGTVATAVVGERRRDSGITTLSLLVPVGISHPLGAIFGDDDSLKLGQTLLGIGGKQTANVSIGIISNIVFDENGGVTSIEASFVSDTAGMPILNLFGEIVGFSTAEGVSTFVSSGKIILDQTIL